MPSRLDRRGKGPKQASVRRESLTRRSFGALGVASRPMEKHKTSSTQESKRCAVQCNTALLRRIRLNLSVANATGVLVSWIAYMDDFGDCRKGFPLKCRGFQADTQLPPLTISALCWSVSDRPHGLAPDSFALFALATALQVHAQACMVAKDRRAIQLRTSFHVCPRLQRLALVVENDRVLWSTESDLLEPSLYYSTVPIDSSR